MSESSARLIFLVARREVIARLQQKGFVIGSLIVIALFGVLALAPKFLNADSANAYDIGLVESSAAGAVSVDDVRDALTAMSNGADGAFEITVHSVSGAAEAREQIREGDLDAVLDGDRIIAQQGGSDAVRLLQSAASSISLMQSLSDAGLSGEQIDSVLRTKPLSLDLVEASDAAVRQGFATVANVALFGQLITFISWVAIGVVEEKSSRVVELVLSAIRPWQLLAGKILGIGVIAVAQLAACAAVGLIVVKATDSVELPSEAYTAIAISFVWFVFGFAFFAAMAAAAASLVSRQEEVSGVLSPVTVLIVASYMLAFAAAASSTFATVVSLAPPFSALTMPARVAHGGVPWWQIAMSLGLLAISAVAMVLVAGRIYRAAVLHAGSRTSLRTAWRGEAASTVR